MNLINPYCELIKKHFTQTIIRCIHRLMHTYRTFSILFKGTYQQSERRPTYICISSTHSAKKNFDRLVCDYMRHFRYPGHKDHQFINQKCKYNDLIPILFNHVI